MNQKPETGSEAVIEDAEIVADDALKEQPLDDQPLADSVADDARTDEVVDEQAPSSSEHADLGEDDGAEADTQIDARTDERAADVAAQDEPTAEVERVVERVEVRRSGFWPIVLGGALCTGVGFGAAKYVDPDGALFSNAPSFRQTATDRLDGLDAQVSELTGTLSATRAELTSTQQSIPTVEALQAPLGTQIESLSAATDTLAARVAELDTLAGRIAELEKRPIAQILGDEDIEAVYSAQLAQVRAQLEQQKSEIGALAGQASDRFASELASLRDEMGQQRAAIDEMAGQAQAKLQAAADRTAQIEAAAAEQSRQAALRSALSRMGAALDAGGGYAQALTDVSAVAQQSIPDVLVAQAEKGVPTLASLRDGFPELARAALVIARRTDAPATDATSRFTAFLQRQVNARSVAPREGDDADAILSRAEAALRGDDLAGALVQLDALPDSAKAPLAAWIAQAQTRLSAREALDALSQELTAN